MARSRTAVWLVASVLAVATAGTSARQEPAAKLTGTASIAGRVIDAISNQPIEGATVSVSQVRGRSLQSAQSEANGNFVLSNLPAGNVNLLSRKAGYLGGGFGLRDPGSSPQDFDLLDGEQAAGIVLRVWKSASLSGGVTDDDGRGVPGVEVKAFPVGVIAGRLGIQAGRRITTDAAGLYQFQGLAPGRYLVSAFAGAAKSSAGGRVGGGGARDQMLDYPVVFFPAAIAASDATSIDLPAGAVRDDVRFVLRSRPTFAVSGVVSGPPTGTRIDRVDLIPEIAATGVWSDLSTATASVNAVGAFTFPRVPPGRYVARVVQCPDERIQSGTLGVLQIAYAGSAGFSPSPSTATLPLAKLGTDPTWWGQATVVVVDGPVANVSIPLQQGARINGAVVFDGVGATPSPDGFRQSAIGIVAPRGQQLPSFQLARLEGDGTFTTVGLPPGTYALVPLPGLPSLTGGAPTWPETWSSVRTSIDGQDQPGELIHLERAGLTVKVTLTAAPARLSGVVKDAAGLVRADASVYIFRSDRDLWTAGAPSREVRPNRRGAYEADLPAGEYFVVASVTAPVLWKEAAALDRLAGSAVVVRVARGDARTLDLVIR